MTPSRRTRGIRFRVLLAVNAVVGVALAGLLYLDYERERSNQVALVREALKGEAKTLLPALQRLREGGVGAVQEHVDSVCGRMRDSTSPGHHIAVVWDGKEVQARAHHRAAPGMVQAMRAAARSAAPLGDGEDALVAAAESDRDMTVYVSELASNVLREVRQWAFERAAGIVAVGIVAAALVNVVLLRLAVKPIRSLAATVQAIGRGDFDVRAGDYATTELHVLASEIDAMGAALHAAEVERRREMRKAQAIQAHLCRISARVPGMRIVHRYRPATEVAGDYYDLLPLPDERWLLSIADVIGHGIPAAMGSAILKTLLLAATERSADPAAILAYVNERLCRVSLPGDFTSAMLVRWDPAASEIEYAGAGHEAGLLLPPSGGPPRRLESTGMVLGILDHAAWTGRRLPVAPGARLLLVTDGVTETASPGRQLFGLDRVAQLLDESRDLPPAEALQRIEQTLETHRAGGRQTDDVTLILAEFTG